MTQPELEELAVRTNMRFGVDWEVWYDLICAAHRAECIHGREDDGTPKDWMAWKDLRDSLEAVRENLKK